MEEAEQIMPDLRQLKQVLVHCQQITGDLERRLLPLKHELRASGEMMNQHNKMLKNTLEIVAKALLGGNVAKNTRYNPGNDLARLVTGLFNMGRKTGGAVAAGNPYLVGESGPELFMPHSSGSVVANKQLSSARPVQLVMNINTPDANSFRMSQSQIMADAYGQMLRATRNL